MKALIDFDSCGEYPFCEMPRKDGIPSPYCNELDKYLNTERRVRMINPCNLVSLTDLANSAVLIRIYKAGRNEENTCRDI